MTPKWIHDNAIIAGPHALFSQYFEIPAGIVRQRVLVIPLVPPNILTSTDSVTVTVTVALDTALANSAADHDPIFGISDGVLFSGFIAQDRFSYPTTSPCRRLEGGSNPSLTSQLDGFGPLVASRRYSGVITLQIRPNERWGSCTTEHDEGYVNIANFQNTLNPNNGLFFEFYRGDDTNEMYRIKYIVAKVDLD